MGIRAWIADRVPDPWRRGWVRLELNATARLRVMRGRLGPLPDFLLPGAMKCGTTSFWRDVTAHPQVSAGIAKEVLFFDQNHHKGEAWYRAFFYDEAVRGRRHGDASLSYLPCAHAPDRARATVPEARIIVLLRNPVDRAISHYFHQRRRNEEPLPLEQAISLEEAEIRESGRVLFDDPRGGWPRFSYLKRGHYAAQLTNWLGYYPREQVLWIRSEDYFANPAQTLAKTFDFLQLDAFEPPRFARAGERGDYPGIDAAVRERLHAHFEAPNAALRELTGGEIAFDQSG